MSKRPNAKDVATIGTILKRETKSAESSMATFYKIIEVNKEAGSVVLENVEDSSSVNTYKASSLRKLFYATDEADLKVLDLRLEAKEEVAEAKKHNITERVKAIKEKAEAIKKGPKVGRKSPKTKTAKPATTEAAKPAKKSNKLAKTNAVTRQTALSLKAVLVEQLIADKALAGIERKDTKQYEAFKRAGGFIFTELSPARKGYVKVAVRGDLIDSNNYTDEELAEIKFLPNTYHFAVNAVYILKSEADIPFALKLLNDSFRSAIR